MNAISRLATVARRWMKKGRKEEDVVYSCLVVQEPVGWLVIEIQWPDLLHFLKKRPKFNGLPDDIVKAPPRFFPEPQFTRMSYVITHPFVFAKEPDQKLFPSH